MPVRDSRNSVLGQTALVLSIALVMIFLFYFIAYVNGGTDLLFYSFALFIILALIIAYDRKFMEYALLLSIALLFSSAVAFFNLCNEYYVFGAIIVFFAILPLSKCFGVRRGRLFFVMLALFLPILFSVALSNLNYLTNVAVLGYYLVISVVLAAFLEVFVASNGLEGRSRRLAKRVMAHKEAILVCFVFVSVAALLSPIWPIGAGINFGTLPYVPISLAGNSGAAGNYTLYFNASAYGNYEAENLGNVRFLLQNMSVINATMLSNSSFTNTRASVMLELPAGTSAITLRFLPTNASFDAYLKPVNPTLHYATMPLTAAFGNLTGGLNYSTRVVQHVVYLEKGMEYNESVISSPYYLAGPLCTPGNDTQANITAVSNVTSSLFLFNNSGTFYKALADSRRYVPYAAYLNTSPYALYVNSFANRSDSRVLNGTNLSLNFSFPENVSCVQYVLVFNRTANIRIGTMTHYLTYITRERWVYGPEKPFPGGSYLNYGLGFMPVSIEHVIQVWQKWWVVSPTLASLPNVNTLV